MSSRSISSIVLPVIALAVSIAPQALTAQLSSNATVVASGLQGPRGLHFGPDGDLYVAEAGTGGTNSTGGECAQVPTPVGPYTGGMTARISKFDKNWNRTTVASGLPSTVDAMGDLQGVSDLQFVNETLYALVSGGGCSHGNPLWPDGVYVVNQFNGKWGVVADISSFMQANPVQYPNPDDFEPDGTPYSMVAVNNKLDAVEPNSGQVLEADPKSGKITRQIDVSASQGHIVPTAIVQNNGGFLLGNLNLFPIEPNTSRVMTLSRSSGDQSSAPGMSVPGPFHITSSKAGFATVVGLAFGPNGLLYVLQLSAGTPYGYPGLGAGKVTRINRDGSLTDVVTGLSVPTAMTFGPKGQLYISNFGAAPAGAGQIVMATVH
jgi:hypothetical protein